MKIMQPRNQMMNFIMVIKKIMRKTKQQSTQADGLVIKNKK